MMTLSIGAICNCRPGECLGLRTLAIDVETIFCGGMTLEVNMDLRTGCRACGDACHFRAVSSIEVSGENKARVLSSSCFGCGLCPTGAISLKIRRAPLKTGIWFRNRAHR